MEERVRAVLSLLRQILWPVKKRELRKFIPIAFIMFFIVFNVSALRTLRESLIVPALGPEVVNFIKLYCLLPSAIAFSAIYSMMTQRFDYRQIVYIIASFFIVVFAIFAFLLYPNQELIHANKDTITRLTLEYPYIKWMIVLCGNWSFALLFVMVELWLSAMLNLLFWQFTNQVTTSEDAGRLYGSYIFVGHLGPIAAGGLVAFLANTDLFVYTDIFPYTPTKHVLVYMTMSIIIAAVFLVMYLFYKLHKDVLGSQYVIKIAQGDTKKKLGFLNGLKMVFASRYLSMIAMIIICYATLDNICESVWRSQIANAYKTEAEYTAFTGMVQQLLGVSTVVMTLFGSSIVRFLSWKFAAMTTPIIFLITGSLMFIATLFGQNAFDLPFLPVFAESVMFVVYVGLIQNVLGKGSKYALLDACKEMSYIPLAQDLKTRGKAAVDVVCMHIGKSSGALMQVLLFTIFPMATYNDLMPHLAAIFIIFITVWIFSTSRLAKLYAIEKSLVEKPE